MNIKLTQKLSFKKSQVFELTDNTLHIHVKNFLKEEKLTLLLNNLSPDPVINGSFMEFHSHDSAEPLISILIDKPNANEFNAFINQLKKRVLEEYNTIAERNSSTQAAAVATNRYEEPPEFEEIDKNELKNKGLSINVADVDIAIDSLNRFMDEKDISLLLTALKALKTEPQNETYQEKVVRVFNELGPLQGAVLTYAPYLNIFVSDDPFADH